jgi:addiction module RelE/StbE family toxin
MKIKWSPLSVERLTSAVSYISEDKPIAAQNLADSIIKAVEHLKDFPQSGRIVPELENLKYREILVKNYRIIYTITENVIHILTIRHQIQLLNTNNIK